MKFSLLLSSILVLAACGKTKDTQGNNVGEIRTFSPVIIDNNEIQRLESICAAVKSKVLALSVSNTRQYAFDVTQKNCTVDADLTGAPVATVGTLIKNDYTFVRVDNNLPFVFPDIVTASTVPLSEICNATSTFPAPSPSPLTSPKQLSNGALMYFTTSLIAGRDCQPGSNQLCLLVEIAAPVPNTSNYQLISQEWMRFQLDPQQPNYGYYLERKQVTSVGCGTNQCTQTRVVLK